MTDRVPLRVTIAGGHPAPYRRSVLGALGVRVLPYRGQSGQRVLQVLAFALAFAAAAASPPSTSALVRLTTNPNERTRVYHAVPLCYRHT